MNNLREMDRVVLDNNEEYLIVYIMRGSKCYGYFINVNDFTDIIFCEILSDSLEIINESEIKRDIINKMTKQMNMLFS